MLKSHRGLRLSCAMACEILHPGTTVLGTVFNTSAGGLGVRVVGRLPPVDQVTIALTTIGLKFDAEVRWRRGDRLGLRILRTGELGARALPVHPVLKPGLEIEGCLS